MGKKENINLRWIMGLNIKTKTIKLLIEHIEEEFYMFIEGLISGEISTNQ